MVYLQESKDIKDWSPVISGLLTKFKVETYQAILEYCGILPNKNPKLFWRMYIVKEKTPDGLVPVGMTGLYTYAPGGTPADLWLGWTGVFSEHRSRGIGTGIIDCLVEEAHKFGAYRILEHYNYENQKDAKWGRWLKGCGFRACDQLQLYCDFQKIDARLFGPANNSDVVCGLVLPVSLSSLND